LPKREPGRRVTGGIDGYEFHCPLIVLSRIDVFSRGNNQEWDMYDLTGFQRDLLYAAAGQDEPHGLAIKDELEDYYETEIHHGRLYPNLDTLVDKGLVEKGQIDRRTNSYEVTQRGRREIDARREWEEQYVAAEA
jgi:PadR family transcriptional regulator PadR